MRRWLITSLGILGSLLWALTAYAVTTATIVGGGATTTTPWLSVKSYGAVGDNATNDTAAIQAAIDAAEVSGGTVYFPKGIYLISSPLTIQASKVRLLGEGSRQSTLKIGTYFNTPPLGGTVTAMLNIIGQIGQTATRITDITIEGLHFYGDPHLADANEPKCISPHRADYVVIQRNYFENFGHECLWPSGSGGGNSVHHYQVINNVFVNIGIGSNSPSSVTINGDDFVVNGNIFDTCLGGVGASGARAVITGNIVKNAQQFGMASAGDTPGSDDVVISGNQIEITAGTQNRWGIAVISGARNTVVSGNTIRLTTTASGNSLYGIRLQGPHDGGEIIGNTIYLDGVGALTSGQTLQGINGFDNGQGFNAVMANNVIKLVNEGTYNTVGMAIKATGASDNMTMILVGNVIKGFSRANAAYAYDLQRTNGSLRYTLIGNMMDGGFFRHGATLVSDGSTDNVPMNLNVVLP